MFLNFRPYTSIEILNKSLHFQTSLLYVLVFNMFFRENRIVDLGILHGTSRALGKREVGILYWLHNLR